MKNCITKVFVTVLMLFALMPLTVMGQDVTTEEIIIDGIKYQIFDGVRYRTANVIENTGVDAETQEKIYYYKGDIEIPSHVVYQEKEYTVSEISEGAFKNCTELTSIKIADSVRLGGSAFEGCTALRDITFPHSNVPDNCFKGCTMLENLTLPGYIGIVSTDAFADCTGLKKVSIRSVSEQAGSIFINDYAFAGCSNLEEVSFDGVYNLEMQDGYYLEISVMDHAFEGCEALKNILLPENRMLRLDPEALSGCPDAKFRLTLSTAELPNCFFRVEAPLVLTFTEDVKEIPEYAFSQNKYPDNIWTGLCEVVFPESVEKVGYGAFETSPAIKRVTVWNKNAKFGWRVFRAIESVEIPEGYVVDDMFGESTGLKEVKFGESITRIGKRAFKSVSLPELIIPEHITCIDEEAFSWCDSLEKVVFPETFKELGRGAFFHCGITEIEVPASLTSLKSGVFEGCFALERAVVPVLYYDMFLNCSKLSDVKLLDSVTKISACAFSGCSSLESIEIPESVTAIEYEAFAGSGLKEMEIPASVEEILYRSFFECKKLTKINIPASVKTIEENPFRACPLLTDVRIEGDNFRFSDGLIIENATGKVVSFLEAFTPKEDEGFEIPSDIAAIGDGAFANIVDLKSVTLPEGIGMLGKEAFMGCSGITEVNCMAAAPPSAGFGCWSGISSNAVLFVPVGSKSAYEADNSYNLSFSEIREKEFVSLQGIGADDFDVRVIGSSIYVSGLSDGAEAEVFNMDGTRVAVSVGGRVSDLPRGHYIVRVAGRSFKTVL